MDAIEVEYVDQVIRAISDIRRQLAKIHRGTRANALLGECERYLRPFLRLDALHEPDEVDDALVEVVELLQSLLDDDEFSAQAKGIRFEHTIATTPFYVDEPGRQLTLERAIELLNIAIKTELRVHTGEARQFEDIRRTVPQQKVAPLKFEIKDGVLRLLREPNTFDARDAANIWHARSELLDTGRSILDQLQRSNCDKRLAEAIRYVQEQLEIDDNIIRIGMSNMRSSTMCELLHDELPPALLASIRTYTRQVDMFAAQFPDWQRFLENAVSAQLDPSDTTVVRETASQLIEQLKTAPDAVDPAVPVSFERLIEAWNQPGLALTRLTYATVRSIENLVSSIVTHSLDFIAQTVDHTKKIAAKWTSYAILFVLLHQALPIGALTQRVPGLEWLKPAIEFILKQRDRLMTK